MLKNKHLKKLHIILSCAGLMSNVIASGPETRDPSEYDLTLNISGKSYEDVKILLTQQQLRGIQRADSPERFLELLNEAGFRNPSAFGSETGELKKYKLKLGTLAGEFYEYVNISLTQQQFNEIESGKCPEGFVESLNKASFSNLKEYELYNFTAASYPNGLRIEGNEITLTTVKQAFRLRVDWENKRIYIHHPEFRHEVYAKITYQAIKNSFNFFRIKSSRHNGLEDLNAAFRYHVLCEAILYIDNVRSRFVSPYIGNDDELIELCDDICLLQELARKRRKDIQDTSIFLRGLGTPSERYRLIRDTVHEYTLTDFSEYIHDHEYGARYEFFLEDESEKNDWYEEGGYSKDTFTFLGFFLESKMVLKKVKFLDCEYNFEKKCYLLDPDYLEYIEELLNGATPSKLSTLSDCRAAHVAFDSFNLEEVLAPIKRELIFIESLAKSISEDMWNTSLFLNGDYSNCHPCYIESLLIQDPGTKGYSIKCRRKGLSFLCELGIENTPDSLSVGLLDEHQLNMMKTTFIRSIKVGYKNYDFLHTIHVAKEGRELSIMLYEIIHHLGIHLQSKLKRTPFRHAEEQWTSIDLAEAMTPIEEMCS